MTTPSTNTDSRPAEQQCLVPYFDPSTASPAVAAALNVLPFKRNIFLLLGHSAGLFPPLMAVYGTIFDASARKLPLLDWQLVVLRIAAVLKAEYEWDVNAPVARQHGMPEAQLKALSDSAADVQRDDASNVWSERQRAILRLVDQQLETYNNTEDAVATLRRFLSIEEVIEVYIILGLYLLIARLTQGLRIDLDGEVPGIEDAISKLR